MSKNEKPEIKSWGEEQLKEKQTKVNKKRRNDNNKLPEEKRKPEPEDISKTFPNFSVLTEEERLAFFEALTTARKNAENKGVPTRKCFGTVHDEYLKYFERNDQGEENKQEENRSIKSNFTIRDNGTNCCSIQSETLIEPENPVEEERSTPDPLPQDDTQDPPRSAVTATLATNIWEQYESLIQTEANKVVDLFLKKKKRDEEKADNLQCDKKIVENRGSGNKNWIALRFSKELDTPRFDALNPEEKEVFFKILQEAYENVLQQNPNEDFQIMPLDAILRRYQGCDEMAAVFGPAKESRRCKEPKKDLKDSVAVNSKGNEGQVEQTNVSMSEKPKKIELKNQYPVEIEDGSQSQEVVQKAERVTLESNFAECKTPESVSVADEPSKESLKAPKTSPKNKESKLCGNETANNEKIKLKKKGKEKKLECRCRECAQEITDVSPVPSTEKESTSQEGSVVQLFEKNSKEMEEMDCVSVLSVSEKSFEENPLSQSSSYSEKSKEDHEETKPEEKRSESSVTVTEQEPEKTEKEPETAAPTKPENKLMKKVSFVSNDPKSGSSELVNEDNENAKNEKNEPEAEQLSMRKEDQKENSSSENPLEEKTKDISWNRVMLVNGDVVEKLKRLIYYLEAKANKDSHLEKEYLRLLVDYADYLSKVLESLILRKEKQQNQQKNAHEASEYRRHHDDSQKKTQSSPKSVEPELPSTSSTKPESQKKHLTFAVMDETIKDLEKDLDSNLPDLSDSESLGSEGETRFRYRKDGRERILPTKIRMLQDVLRQRAEFIEGNFDDFKVIQLPEEKFVPEEKPPTVKLLAEDETKGPKSNKKKFFDFLSKIFLCGRRSKTSAEDGILENLRGEAFRVEMTKSRKDPASAVLNQATLEVLKAVERKKIIDKYFMKS